MLFHVLSFRPLHSSGLEQNFWDSRLVATLAAVSSKIHMISLSYYYMILKFRMLREGTTAKKQGHNHKPFKRKVFPSDWFESIGKKQGCPTRKVESEELCDKKADERSDHIKEDSGWGMANQSHDQSQRAQSKSNIVQWSLN